MGEMIPIPKLSRDFEAPVREVFNTSTVPRFFFLSMVRLPWCDGEDRLWQQAAPAQVRCAWQIHLSGWWFQNVSDVLWHVYPISQQWDDWSPNSPTSTCRFSGEQPPTSWNLILNRCGLNSVVHEHVEQCEMLRSFPAKWLLAVWIAAPPALGNMKCTSLRIVETSPTLGSLRWWGHVQSRPAPGWAWYGWRLSWSQKIVDQLIWDDRKMPRSAFRGWSAYFWFLVSHVLMLPSNNLHGGAIILAP